jgi:hypothetical protein
MGREGGNICSPPRPGVAFVCPQLKLGFFWFRLTLKIRNSSCFSCLIQVVGGAMFMFLYILIVPAFIVQNSILGRYPSCSEV